jgi:hypothetical protein
MTQVHCNCHCQEQILRHAKNDSTIFLLLPPDWLQRLFFSLLPSGAHIPSTTPGYRSRHRFSQTLSLSKLPPKQAHVRSSISTPMHCNADASSIEPIQPIATTIEEEGVPAPVDEACHHKTFFQMHATLRMLNSVRVLFEVPNCFTSQPPRYVLLLVGCLTAVSRLFVIPMEGCQ